MHPVLLQLGSYVIGTHNFFISLGVIAGAFVFLHECRRRGEMSEQMLWIVAGALVGGAVGAKLSAVFGTVGEPSAPALGAVVMHGGRSIIGGLVGGYIGVLATKRLVGYPRKTGDLFAPGLALGMGIGRWGCFFSELPGTPTHLPWGIRLTALQVAQLPDCPDYCRTSALHPSLLYEIIFDAAMFAMLWFRWRRNPALRDQLLKLFLLCYAVFRFFVEFVRGHDVMAAGLTGAQLFLIPVILVLSGYFLHRMRGQQALRLAS